MNRNCNVSSVRFVCVETVNNKIFVVALPQRMSLSLSISLTTIFWLFFQLEPGVALPPPSALKRKILIKNKRLKPDVEKIELEMFQQGQFVLDDAEEPKEDASAAPPPDKAGAADTPVAAAPAEAAAEGAEGAEVPINYTGSTTNVHPWLSSMINYAQPIKFQGFDVAESKYLYSVQLALLLTIQNPLYRKKHSPQHVFVCRNHRNELP